MSKKEECQLEGARFSWHGNRLSVNVAGFELYGTQLNGRDPQELVSEAIAAVVADMAVKVTAAMGSKP